MHEKLSGSAEWANQWKGFQVTQTSDVEFARELLQHLQQADSSTTSLPTAQGVKLGFSETAPLAWGEVVPLYFLYQKEDFSALSKSNPPVIISTWPQARMNPVEYTPKACELGRALLQFCELEHPFDTNSNCSSRRISIIFSCDMSHVHGSPVGTAAMYCGHPSLGENKQLAAHFDKLLVQWATLLAVEGDTVKARDLLFNQAILTVADAKACGWAGFCAMQSLFEALEEHRRTIREPTAASATAAVATTTPAWIGKVHGYFAPTYFGMMAVSVLLE